jgi:hypothetical protein
VFYHVFRAPSAAAAIFCGNRIGASADYCSYQLTDLGTTKTPFFRDASPPEGSPAYYVGVAANWLDDPSQGDVYEMSPPASVR